MRVVLDTNILISSCVKPGGLEEKVLELGLNGQFEMVATPAVLAEYREVLGRPKFAKYAARVDALLARLNPVIVKQGPVLSEALDEDDNRILECAVAAGATFIVTGNLKDFPLDWKLARIVNARQFLDHYSSFADSAVP